MCMGSLLIMFCLLLGGVFVVWMIVCGGLGSSLLVFVDVVDDVGDNILLVVMIESLLFN